MRQTTLSLALCAVFATPAFAETLPDFVGETIVVTPTRFLDSATDRAVNVTVISREDIDRNPAVTIPEMLRDYAGIGMRDLFGNNASNSTVDLRGFGAAAGQNTLVLVDGVRQNDIDLSSVVWSAIPLSAIERIEIVRGGNSVLHGSGAVGGVINIITRAPGNRLNEATLAARYGSFNTRDLQATGSLAGEDVGLTLAANSYRSDGWRENNENSQDSAYGNARWKLDRGEIALKLGADKQNLRLPGARIVEPDQNRNELTSNPEGAQTPRDWAKRDGWQAVLSGQFELPKGEVVADLNYRSKSQEAYFYFGGYPSYRETVLDMLTFSPRVKLPLQAGGVKHELILGTDLGVWDYRLLTSDDPGNIGQPINRVQADQNNAALYAQDHVRLSGSLSLTAGARMEWFRIKATDRYDASAPGAYGSGAPAGKQREREHAWELGLRYRSAPQHTLYAKMGRSFRFATVDEIYENNASYSNEFQFLKPQTALDAELGWEIGAVRHGGRVALYHARVRDEIHLDPYGSGIGNTNLPPLRRYGLELEGRSSVGAVDVTAAYTLAFAEFTSGVLNGVLLKGNDVPLVPRHKLALNATWNISQATRLTGSANYVSSQTLDNDEPNTLGVKIPAYTVADVRLEHRVGNWKLAAAINNVLDEAYHTYAVRSQFDADRYAAYPLPGRHGWASVAYSFK
ncbi:MAG: TonB-dependent receptor [Thiobacillus sp.]|nr:TonB-dependent receptor [Thiobacillus sp.]